MGDRHKGCNPFYPRNAQGRSGDAYRTNDDVKQALCQEIIERFHEVKFRLLEWDQFLRRPLRQTADM